MTGRREYPATPRERVEFQWYVWRVSVKEWWRDGLPGWIAHRLPRRVVYHALIRAWVFSLSGKHGHLTPTEVRADEMVRRWEQEDH